MQLRSLLYGGEDATSVGVCQFEVFSTSYFSEVINQQICHWHVTQHAPTI